jgi:serine/threonine-protein phosphatase 2B regulatory subunit
MELQQVVDKTIRDCDTDGDGKISFDEFRAMVERRNADFFALWNFNDL